MYQCLSLGSMASSSQLRGWLDPVPPLLLPVQGGFTPKFINTEMHSINLTTKETE